MNAHSKAATADSTSLAPYANLLRFSFFNATTWMIGLGTPLVLLASELGASSFEVGLMYAFVFLLLPIQILATSTLPRYGYKRQVTFGWTSRGFFLLIPLSLAWLAPEQPEDWMVHALIASAFGFSFFRAIGSCAVMPMIYATLPEEVRGKYFSTDQAVIGVSGILTLLLCAASFRFLPAYEAFFAQYLYAIVGTALTLYFLTRFKDPPRPEATSLREIGQLTPQLCLGRSPFRQYLGFMVTHALLGTAFVPLQAYYLKVESGIGSDLILVYTAIQFVGAILGTVLVRNRIDRIGVKPIFRLSLTTGGLISIYWFFLVRGESGLLILLPAAYFLFGLSASLWVTANLKYLPRVCDERKQALHVSVHSSVIGIVGGLAPIFWGLFVKESGNQAGVRADAFSLFFVAFLIIQTVLFLYVPQLTSQFRERPALQNSSALLRPFRYLGNLVNPIPSDDRKPPARKDGP